jgi:hypothetical protein
LHKIFKFCFQSLHEVLNNLAFEKIRFILCMCKCNCHKRFEDDWQSCIWRNEFQPILKLIFNFIHMLFIIGVFIA